MQEQEKEATRSGSVVDAAEKQHKDTVKVYGAALGGAANLNLGRGEDKWTGEQIKHPAQNKWSPLLADNDSRDVERGKTHGGGGVYGGRGVGLDGQVCVKLVQMQQKI